MEKTKLTKIWIDTWRWYSKLRIPSRRRRGRKESLSRVTRNDTLRSNERRSPLPLRQRRQRRIIIFILPIVHHRRGRSIKVLSNFLTLTNFNSMTSLHSIIHSPLLLLFKHFPLLLLFSRNDRLIRWRVLEHTFRRRRCISSTVWCRESNSRRRSRGRNMHA
jgi:hypothetical protein